MGPKHHQHQPHPRAYSTRLSGDGQAGYTTDGHSIVIDPQALEASVEHFRKGLAGQSPRQLATTLMAAIDTAQFGTVPGAEHVSTQVTTFIREHVEAMQSMGVSIADFVARVQAAAQLGYETDPETRRIASQTGNIGPMKRI